MRLRVGINLDLGSIIRAGGGGANQIIRSAMSADCRGSLRKRWSEGELGAINSKVTRRAAVTVAGFCLQAAAVRDALGVGMPVVGKSGEQEENLLEKMEAAPAGLRRSAGSAGITQIFAGKEAKQVCTRLSLYFQEVFTGDLCERVRCVCTRVLRARAHARTHARAHARTLTHSRTHAHAHTHRRTDAYTHTLVCAHVCARVHVWCCQWHARCAWRSMHARLHISMHICMRACMLV
jgi:hypothetical protein